jgi:hypothetical protein
MGLIWVTALFRRTVAWRGNRYRLGRDTQIVPVSRTRLSVAKARLLFGIPWRTSARKA